MKLLLLNIHLEWNHNRLRKLVEKDTRKGMDEVFLVMYDYEGYKKKKSLESLLQENPKALVEPLPLPSPDSIKFELSEEEEDVDDPGWNKKTVAKPAAKVPVVVGPKMAMVNTVVRPKVELARASHSHSSGFSPFVSTPSPCLLCKEKGGRELRLVGGRTSEVHIFSFVIPINIQLFTSFPPR